MHGLSLFTLLKDNGVCIYDTLLQNPVKLLAFVISVTGILKDCTSGKKRFFPCI